MTGNILLYGLLSILLAIIAVFGWLWNILIVVVMIRNELPVGRRYWLISAIPFGLSLYFAGIGLGLAILWYKDFRDGRYPDDAAWVPDEDWVERLDEYCAPQLDGAGPDG